MQLLEGEHDHLHHSEKPSVCEIDPNEIFKNISTLVNVTCINEDLKIL